MNGLLKYHPVWKIEPMLVKHTPTLKHLGYTTYKIQNKLKLMTRGE